jgi:hypothetical protein
MGLLYLPQGDQALTYSSLARLADLLGITMATMAAERGV